MTTDGPLTEKDRQQIRTALREIQAAENVPNSVMARILGCSQPLYSQLVKGTYKGDVDRWLARARQWMADRAERAEMPQVTYVETSIGRAIMTVCRRSWAKSRIGRVITPSGCGKTAALVEFARRRGDRALYLSAGECFSSKRALLGEIARQMGMRHARHDKLHELYPRIRDLLAGYYAQGKADPFCLIIDEATTLRADTLNMLRNLSDDPDCRVALVLADTWRLDVELHRPRGIAGGYEQLRSRIGVEFKMRVDDEISLADVKAVADSILDALGHKRRLRESSYRYLSHVTQIDGKFRNLVHRLEAVCEVAEATGTPAEYSVAQLDYVATLVGHDCQMEHAEPPFGRPARAAARRTA